MALVLADRVRETTTTTGTGTVSLAGPVSGFQGFSTGVGNANTTYYTIVDAATGAWEVGLGTYTSSGSTLSRDTVFASSNSGSLVPFAAGTKDVFVTQPAERAVYVLGAGTGLAAGAAAFTLNGVPYANSTSTLATSSNLTFDGTTLTANALTTTSTVTINGGTANGVTYLNGSKVLTSGAALTFDGTNISTALGGSYYSANSNYGFGTPDSAGLQIFTASGDSIRLGSRSSGTFTELARLTSTGLGIGTSSPDYKLQISGTSGQTFSIERVASAIGSSTSLGTIAGTGEIPTLTADGASIQFLGAGTWSSTSAPGRIVFNTTPAATTTPVERFQLAATEAVFNDPGNDYDFRVESDTDTHAFFVQGSDGSVFIGASGALNNSYTTPKVEVVAPSSSEVCFAFESATNTQNVGLYFAHQTTSGSPQTRNGSRIIDVPTGAYTAGTGATYSAALTFWTTNANTVAERFRITAAGNLGIGTSSPGVKLDVVGELRTQNTSPAGITVKRTDGVNANGWLNFVGSDDVVDGSVRMATDVANALTFLTASTERLRLDASGNLGLGVTPSAWDSTYKAIQVGARSMFYGIGSEANMANNAYYNSGYKYVANSAAGLYTIDANVHKWYNAASGTAGNAITFTQALTLDASGNLGIGTSSPITKTHVRVSALSGYTSVANLGLLIERGDGPAALNIASPNTESGFIWFADQDSASVGNIAYNHPSNFMSFQTNGSERARIDSSGNLLVGTTSGIASERLFVSGSNANYIERVYNSNASPYGIIMSYTGAAPNGTVNEFFRCDDTGAVRMSVRSNGGIANYQANDVNLSDRREKTNFAPAKSYLETICAIPVQTFNYIDQAEDDPGLTLGVVAQDVQAVAPELVMESNWGTEEEPKMRLSIYQTDLQYALMKALQELKAEFDAYKASHP